MSARRSVEGQRARPTPLQTTFQRPSTAPHSGTPTSQTRGTSPHLQASPKPDRGPRSGYQRFVLTDPLAFRYLEEDSSTTVLARQEELKGYECYIVEQWATSRTHPTFAITTYTGDPSHMIVVGVLSMPIDENAWSPRLRVYFKALNQYHARRETTALGTLMVTNLSRFPSSLTVIPVPNGDLRKHRADFFVNEDLKRLGCSGRVGLTFGAPSASTVAKFHQLYRTSDKNDIYRSVVELVKLCQSALMLFDKLENDYADGLLCDVTERAIGDWWAETGADQYGIEPHDGILGPTTVAGLLGLLMGARNRLHAVNAPVPKDVFEVDAMKRGISSFQKTQRLPRTRRLDRRTLERLQKVTAKAATSEGWTMPRAVKSTVAELSGKGGEMVLDVVGRRDKAGIAEIETTDFERFVQLVFGERCKWLWYGKPMKKASKAADDVRDPNGALTFQSDQHGGFTWTGRKSTGEGLSGTRTKNPEDLRTPGNDTDGTSEDEQRSKLRKRATDFKNEAISGLDKIRGAVSKKGQQQKPTKGDSPSTLPSTPPPESVRRGRPPFLQSAPTSPMSSPLSPSSPTDEHLLDMTLSPQPMSASPQSPPPLHSPRLREDRERERSADRRATPKQNSETVSSTEQAKTSMAASSKFRGPDPHSGPTSIAGSVYEGVDATEALPESAEAEGDRGNVLRRTLSHAPYMSSPLQTHDADYYPRHLSFSLAEDSVLDWDAGEVSGHPDDGDDDDEDDDHHQARAAKLANDVYSLDETKQLRFAVNELRVEAADWTQGQLYVLRDLVDQAEQDQQTLDAMYFPHTTAVQSLSTNADTLLRDERERMEEAGKELETLAARLNYEIDGLRGRIEDVENVVDDFAKGVDRVERRAWELEHDGEGSGRWGCVVS